MTTDTPRQQWAAAYRNARHMRNLADMIDGLRPSIDTARGVLADAAWSAAVSSGDRLRHRLPIRRDCVNWGYALPRWIGRGAIDGPRGKLP